MLSFDDVTFTYPGGPAPVLRDVSFTVEEGRFVLVCGPTGAGKSTLLRCINGLVPHFSGGTFAGKVTVGDRSTATHPPRRLADTVAFVPQDPGASFVVDRVEDEVAYALENLGVEPAAMRRKVEETLDLLAIEPLRQRSVRSLSGGERQRVAIAAALAPGARLLVLDEPTSQLDPQGAEDVLAALARLVHDLGITVVLAEHRLERVAGFADGALGVRGDGTVTLGPVRAVMDSLGTGPPVAVLGRLMGWEPTPMTVREARTARTAAPPAPPAPPALVERGHAGAPFALAERVTARYDDLVALRDLTVTMPTGAITAVIGRNGAGKSTLLRCLAGLHTPENGRVAIDGEEPAPARNVALCPQRPEDVLFSETVDAELAAGDHAGVEAVAEALDLARFGPLHPRDLSAGRRMLLAVAVTALTGAPLLLLDEPTRGLDHEAKEILGAFLRERAARGAVVVATHDVELVGEIADRVVMLAGGEVIADGAPSQVIGDSPVFAPQVARVFGPGWLTPGAVVEALRS